jgi:hypothetical protein
VVKEVELEEVMGAVENMVLVTAVVKVVVPVEAMELVENMALVME